jgi:hypothetical protein
MTRMIQGKFEDALHGRAPEYSEWLDPIEPARRASDATEASRAVEAPVGGKVSG